MVHTLSLSLSLELSTYLALMGDGRVKNILPPFSFLTSEQVRTWIVGRGKNNDCVMWGDSIEESDEEERIEVDNNSLVEC